MLLAKVARKVDFIQKWPIKVVMNLGVLSLRGAEFKLVAAGPLGVPLKNFGYDAWNVLCGRPGPSLLVIWGDFCAQEPTLLCKISDYVFLVFQVIFLA